MNLRKRSTSAELLDADNIPFDDIKRNMQELDVINTWLGGHGITKKGCADLVKNKKTISICEIGSGGGDNLVALNRWAQAKKIELTLTGIDIKEECTAYATHRFAEAGKINFITSDYRTIRFDLKPDIIFSSLFCHHFSNEQLVEQWRWMYENCTLGFFINDLQRHWLAYHSIKLLTSLFSRSYLVKNDAPLSVARGFHRGELEDIAHRAGFKDLKVEWKWAFRYLMVCRKNERK